MNAAQIAHRQSVVRKFFTTSPSRQNWTEEERRILKEEGLIGKKRSRKMSESEASITGAAYTALSRI